MEIAEVQDADSLARFLDSLNLKDGRPLARKLAFRVACRVAPLAIDFLFRHTGRLTGDSTALSLFRGLAAAATGAEISPPPLPSDAALSASTAANDVASQISDFDRRFDQIAFAADTIGAAAALATNFSGEAFNAVFHSAEKTGIAEIWDAVQRDLMALTDGQEIMRIGLWDTVAVPDQIFDAWDNANAAMKVDPTADWSCWIRWFGRAQVGGPLWSEAITDNLEWLRRKDWARGPAHVNPVFAASFEDEQTALTANDVTDKATLEVYLRSLPVEEGQRTARRVAFRAAARVLPFAMQAYGARVEDSLQNLWIMPVLGGLAVASVADAAPGAVSDGVAYATSLAAATAAEKTMSGAEQALRQNLTKEPMADDINRVVDAARQSSASVTAISAAVTAVAAKDAVPAAVAAVAAACEAVDLWNGIRNDLSVLGNDRLWNTPAPRELQETWQVVESKMNLQIDEWDVWRLLYRRILSGEDVCPIGLAEVLNTFLEKEDWERGPAHINPLFDDVLALYLGEEPDAAPTELAQAAPVEFSFDTLARVMRMVGITDNLGHLKEPGIVQAFVDDAEEVRDLFQDFADYAGELQGGGNYAGILKRAAEKVLGEFDRTEDKMHLRANRLVILASELELFSKDGRARDDLGETLSGLLDTRIEMLKGLCRQHFGPSYLALAPLAQLRLEQVDQQEVIAIFDHAIGYVEALPNPEMVALDAEGVAVLRDMLEELRAYRAAIAEATSDDFQSLLEDRFAQSSGALGLSLTRFYERSVTASGKVGKAADAVIKQNKRVTSLLDIVEAVSSGFGG